MEENLGMVDFPAPPLEKYWHLSSPCPTSLVFRSLKRFVGNGALCNVYVTIEKQTLVSVEEAPWTCYAPRVSDSLERNTAA